MSFERLRLEYRGELFGWFDMGFTNTYAAGTMYQDYSTKGFSTFKFGMEETAFAIGLEAAVLSSIQLVNGCNVNLAISALSLAGASVAFDAYALLSEAGDVSAGDRTMDYVVLAMDGVVFGWNIAELTG